MFIKMWDTFGGWILDINMKKMFSMYIFNNIAINILSLYKIE